jgi:hypothetical protein
VDSPIRLDILEKLAGPQMIELSLDGQRGRHLYYLQTADVRILAADPAPSSRIDFFEFGPAHSGFWFHENSSGSHRR